jgi:ribosomal-protein-alanine N-acetyltransferase
MTDFSQIKILPFSEKYLLDVLKIERMSFSKPWTREMFERELSLPISRFFVLVFDAQITGYAGYWLVGEDAHLLNMAVHPEFRRKGFGKTILEFIVLKAREEGARSMLLEVRKKNLNARALYSSMGFKEVGVRPRYYGDDDAVLMDKTL